MDSDEYDALEHDSKRRRLRKGTHSCWECKRRKVRCTLAASTDTTCIPCRRRGKKCVSQDLPEEPSQTDDNSDNSERLLRVEALLDRLVKQIDNNDPKDGLTSITREHRAHTPHVLTPASTLQTTQFSETNSPSLVTEDIQGSNNTHEENVWTNQSPVTTQSAIYRAPSGAQPPPASAGKLGKLSEQLLAAFPLRSDAEALIEASSGTTVYCHAVYGELRSDVTHEVLRERSTLPDIPAPGTHPVLVAKYMLMLAGVILQLPPQQPTPNLTEPPRVIMERLADTAIDLVTTNEKLLGTVESLECILLEGLYHLNCGNVRRAWLAHRRVMVAAELAGICRQRHPPVKTLDPATKVNSPAMWAQILYMDRFLSLLLGLPRGHSQANLECEVAIANCAETDRLQRLQSVIAAKILERNQITRPAKEKALAMTLDIDKELRQITDSLPAEFWRPPSYADLEKDSTEIFQETMRIKDQMFHYTLLNQLHLPYLLCPNGKNDYSRISCVYASREIMTLFITYRSYNRSSSSCRLADLLALIGGMTLILAHLGSHRQMDNLLTHQRAGDRATIEQALKNMEVSSRLNEDMLEAKCASLLQHMLRIEADAARRNIGPGSQPDDGRNELHITVPYFGALTIGRNGISFTDTLRPLSQGVEGFDGDITIGGIGSIHLGEQTTVDGQVQPSTNQDTALNQMRGQFECMFPQSQLGEQPSSIDNMLVGGGQLPGSFNTNDLTFQQDFYPGIAASVDDWAFQGIDGAFFDKLLVPTGFQAGDGGDIIDWPPGAAPVDANLMNI